MAILYFICAILFICVAHMVRIIRWELFIGIYEKPDRPKLIQAMSFGYILNFFLPFKLGEIARAWYAGRKMKNGRALGFSTVIIDRYLDVVFVGIIFILLSVFNFGDRDFTHVSLTYVLTSLGLLLLAVSIYILRDEVKKGVRVLAGIFNEQIESYILRFSWALIWNFKDIFQKISKISLVLCTVGMWLCYLVSYYFFANFLRLLGDDTTWVDVFLMLFSSNGIKGSTGEATLYNSHIIVTQPVYMVTYMVSPTLILLAISLFLRGKKEDIAKGEDGYLRLLPHMNEQERLDFLEIYFAGKNKFYIDNYLKINQGVSIIRDYSAGSNATTMLCMDDGSTFFRKYAFRGDGEKLYKQICWLEANSEGLNVPKIIGQEKTELYCYYDMPYINGSVGLFEYAHSMPIECTWKIIRNVLESLERTIYEKCQSNSDKKTIHEYVDLKVKKNLEIIKNAKRIKSLYQYRTVFINGIEYRNLPYFEKYLAEEYLQNIFENDTYSIIHGDLTIENIICVRDSSGNDDFYIIDPNTGNVHDSANLDYAKLLQSLHGGYEFLMATKDVKIEDNKISFLFTRSYVYMRLYDQLRDYMLEHFGEEQTRSIYFHEIIHWLRLMPYKIEKDDKLAIIFYAGMLIVLNDVIKMYGDLN